MNRKLFDLIYTLIARSEITRDEAFEMLKDYFHLSEIAAKDKPETPAESQPVVIPAINPTLKPIDPPIYPGYGEILHVGGFTTGDPVYNSVTGAPVTLGELSVADNSAAITGSSSAVYSANSVTTAHADATPTINAVSTITPPRQKQDGFKPKKIKLVKSSK